MHTTLTFQSPGTGRNMGSPEHLAFSGRSAAELVPAIRRELARERAATGDDQRKMVVRGLTRIASIGLVSEQEKRDLARICDLALLAARSARSAAQQRVRIQRMHDAMIDRGAGELARTIASLALDADRLVAAANVVRRRQARASSTASSIRHGINGALAGGFVGGLLGGPPGAALGALAGWIGAGFAGEC